MWKGAEEARCVMLMDALHLDRTNQEGIGYERPTFWWLTVSNGRRVELGEFEKAIEWVLEGKEGRL